MQTLTMQTIPKIGTMLYDSKQDRYGIFKGILEHAKLAEVLVARIEFDGHIEEFEYLPRFLIVKQGA